MGLASAARLIGLNHATLTLKSQPNQGTTATITLLRA